MNVKRTKMKYLLYRTPNIIHSSLNLALVTEKGLSSTTVSIDMQICLRATQIIFKWLYKCQAAKRNIGPKHI